MRENSLSEKKYWTLSKPLPLSWGGELSPVTLAYETWGQLSAKRDNAVLVIHALTGDSHAAGRYADDDPKAGWWDPLIGPGLAFDTDRYFVICSNLVGGCQGSTGPISTNPATGVSYGLDFPEVTLHDMVRAQVELVRGLGISRLAAVAGGSIGGMQALDWAVRYPDMVDSALIFGATGRIGPQAIAFNAVGRNAIMLDPAWRGGRYEPGEGPAAGLSVARMVGMITYQSQESMWLRFGRRQASRASAQSPFGGEFDVEGYLEYQGRSLARRFDANSYLYLTRAMDLYDVAEGFGSEDEALSRVSARTLHVGLSSDWLYPPHEVRATVERLRALGKDASYREIESVHGHDAFLKEWARMSEVVREFLPAQQEVREGPSVRTWRVPAAGPA